MLPHDDRNPFQQNPWKLFRNTTAETIPPFSILRITGAEDFNGAIRITVAKPNATQATAYMVNGPYAVPAGKDGICTTLTQAGYVAYDSGDGTPALGESWGAKNGQWTAEKDVAGFFICGGVTVTAGVNAVVAIQTSSAESTTWLVATATFDGTGAYNPSGSGTQKELYFSGLVTSDGAATFDLTAGANKELSIIRDVNPCFIVGQMDVTVDWSQNNWSQIAANIQREYNNNASWTNIGLGDLHRTAWPNVATVSGGTAYSRMMWMHSGVALQALMDLRGALVTSYSGSSPQVSAGGSLMIYYQ